MIDVCDLVCRFQVKFFAGEEPACRGSSRLGELEDRGVVHLAVNCRHRHAWIWKHVGPTGEGLVGRNQNAASLVALGDQLKQHAGFGLVLSDIRCSA